MGLFKKDKLNTDAEAFVPKIKHNDRVLVTNKKSLHGGFNGIAVEDSYIYESRLGKIEKVRVSILNQTFHFEVSELQVVQTADSLE